MFSILYLQHYDAYGKSDVHCEIQDIDSFQVSFVIFPLETPHRSGSKVCIRFKPRHSHGYEFNGRHVGSQGFIPILEDVIITLPSVTK